MNKFIRAITSLDTSAVRDFLKDSKWAAQSEPSGKNALQHLGGTSPWDDPEKAKASPRILQLLLKSGLNINSVHHIEEKNCDHFPATPQ